MLTRYLNDRNLGIFVVLISNRQHLPLISSNKSMPEILKFINLYVEEVCIFLYNDELFQYYHLCRSISNTKELRIQV